MANFNFNEYEAAHQKPASQQSQNGESKSYIQNIKVADGGEAVVRFFISTSDDIEITTVHNIDLFSTKTNKSYSKSISCLRESYQDPLDTCPLCAQGNEVKARAYIKLLEYVNVNGEIVATPRIWDASKTNARTVNSFLADYGDLTEYLFKLKRTGTGTSTRYNLVPIPATSPVYKPEVYKKEFEKFDDYYINPYLKKSFDEVQVYVETGKFPERVKESTQTPSDNTSTTTEVETPRQVSQPTTNVEQPQQVQRPKRFTY